MLPTVPGQGLQGVGSQPSALEERTDELILSTLVKRKGDLAEGHKIGAVRGALINEG
jgi:hypothetical protein